MHKRILVIDDEEAVRDAFELALRPAGYEVASASTGEEGVARALDLAPDVVFLDLRMPGIDGVETLRRLRAHNFTMPIYIVTAFRRDFMIQLGKAAEDGLDFQVMDKPLTGDQIRAVVRAAFGQPQLI